MKKIVRQCLLLLFPVITFAQSEPNVYKDFATKTKGLENAFTINDQAGVFQIMLTDTTFELVAVDNNMHLLWQTTLQGHAVGSGKFRGHVLAVSAAGYSKSTEMISPYTVFLIDEQTGKILQQKEIYEKKGEHHELANVFFSEDGSQCNLIIRQANRHTGALSGLKDDTEYLDIISFDDHLEPAYVKPAIPDGTFINMTFNQSGDLFILTLKNYETLIASRYEHGSDKPPVKIEQPFLRLTKSDVVFGQKGISPAEDDRNLLYFGITRTNAEFDRVLGVVKFDFNTHTAKVDSEVFTGPHVRNMKKQYKSVNDTLKQPVIGHSNDALTVRYLREHHGKILMVLSEQYSVTNGGAGARYYASVTAYDEYAQIINYYDSNFKPLFQQLMPVYYEWDRPISAGFHLSDSSFTIFSNNIDKSFLLPLYAKSSVHGKLDLSTGQWQKLAIATGPKNYTCDEHVLWFKHAFIVPYTAANAGLFSNTSYDIDLQLTKY